jgi:hypothetical protein
MHHELLVFGVACDASVTMMNYWFKVVQLCVLCAGYVHLFKEEVTRSLAYVATKQHERCMKWFTASNQTLQAAFPLICETVYHRQPNKMTKLVFVSHGVIQGPQHLRLTPAPKEPKKSCRLLNAPLDS